MINNNKITNDWKDYLGTGATGYFEEYTYNGGYNERIYGENPWGEIDVLWKSTGTTSNYRGGFVTDRYVNGVWVPEIDSSKDYRISVFLNLKKKNLTLGRFYFGWDGYNDGSLDEAYNIVADVWTNYTYVYLDTTPDVNEDEWYLVYGYIRNSGATTTDSNFYGRLVDMDGNLLDSRLQDYRFSGTTNSIRLECYSPYNGDDSYHLYMPRVDVIDGNEPSIAELLNPGGVVSQHINMIDNNKITIDWEDYLGTGATEYFLDYTFSGGINTRLYDLNPYGEIDVMWQGAGINSSSRAYMKTQTLVNSEYEIPVDYTNDYRYSCFVKKKESGSIAGRLYFGCFPMYNGYSVSLERVDTTGTASTIYFWNANPPPFTEGEWYLMVAYIRNINYTGGTDSNYYTRVYKLDGTELANNTAQWKFYENCNHIQTNIFAPYNGTDKFHFYQPRLDVIDGNEPSIVELSGNIVNLSLYSREIENFDSINTILHLDAGDSNSYPGTGYTWYDLSGNDNHAYGDPGRSGSGYTDDNFPLYQSDGGGSFYFNNSGLTILNDLGTQSNATFEVWIKISSNDDTQYLFDARNDGGDYYLLNYGGYNINVAGHLRANFPTTYNTDSNWWYRWTHLVFSSDATGSKLWVDGNPITDSRLVTSTTIDTNLGQYFRVGRRYTASSGYLVGYISYIKIYDSVLSDLDVRKLYDSTKSRYGYENVVIGNYT